MESISGEITAELYFVGLAPLGDLQLIAAVDEGAVGRGVIDPAQIDRISGLEIIKRGAAEQQAGRGRAVDPQRSADALEVDVADGGAVGKDLKRTAGIDGGISHRAADFERSAFDVPVRAGTGCAPDPADNVECGEAGILGADVAEIEIAAAGPGKLQRVGAAAEDIAGNRIARRQRQRVVAGSVELDRRATGADNGAGVRTAGRPGVPVKSMPVAPVTVPVLVTPPEKSSM